MVSKKAIKEGILQGKNKEAMARLIKVQLAKKDPWIFITEFCRTDFNKRVNQDTFRAACETIPPYDYLKELVREIHKRRMIAVPKSRRMLVTWIVLCYVLWYALGHSNVTIYLQKIKEDDAGFADPNESLCSRILKVYNRLPKELQQRKELGITKKPPVINFKETGSSIIGVAEGPDQLRGKDATIIVIDEMAMLKDNKQTFETIMPIVNTGAKLIGISTPNGQENFYAWVDGREME